MRREEIARRVRTVLVRELRCPGSRVTENAEFVADLGAMPAPGLPPAGRQGGILDKLAVMMALEDEFGIKLTDREVAFCETVGTAIDLVETKLENRRVT
ncbi:MAG TPA: acyl carrier protein [Sphingomicrobium sp.]|jgi:hypothetical protein|nr:acyl carrier protein [Sphingomicrobium sp.]